MLSIRAPGCLSSGRDWLLFSGLHSSVVLLRWQGPASQSPRCSGWSAPLWPAVLPSPFFSLPLSIRYLCQGGLSTPADIVFTQGWVHPLGKVRLEESLPMQICQQEHLVLVVEPHRDYLGLLLPCKSHPASNSQKLAQPSCRRLSNILSKTC